MKNKNVVDDYPDSVNIYLGCYGPGNRNMLGTIATALQLLMDRSSHVAIHNIPCAARLHSD